MAAMLDRRNNENILHEKRFHFPEHKKCIVAAIQHACHSLPNFRCFVLRLQRNVFG